MFQHWHSQKTAWCLLDVVAFAVFCKSLPCYSATTAAKLQGLPRTIPLLAPIQWQQQGGSPVVSLSRVVEGEDVACTSSPERGSSSIEQFDNSPMNTDPIPNIHLWLLQQARGAIVPDVLEHSVHL